MPSLSSQQQRQQDASPEGVTVTAPVTLTSPKDEPADDLTQTALQDVPAVSAASAAAPAPAHGEPSAPAAPGPGDEAKEEEGAVAGAEGPQGGTGGGLGLENMFAAATDCRDHTA